MLQPFCIVTVPRVNTSERSDLMLYYKYINKHSRSLIEYIPTLAHTHARTCLKTDQCTCNVFRLPSAIVFIFTNIH